MAVTPTLGLTKTLCFAELNKFNSKNLSVIGRYKAKKYVGIGGIVATIAFMAVTFFTGLRVFTYASFPFGALVSVAINKLYAAREQALISVRDKITLLSKEIIPTNKTFRELIKLSSFDLLVKLCKTMNCKQLEEVRKLVTSRKFRQLIQERANPAHGDFRKLDEYLQKTTAQKIEVHKNEMFSSWLVSNPAMQRLVLQDALKQKPHDKTRLTTSIDELTGYYFKNQKTTTFTFGDKQSVAYSRDWLFNKCGLINSLVNRFTELDIIDFNGILNSPQEFQDLDNCFKILRGLQDLPEDITTLYRYQLLASRFEIADLSCMINKMLLVQASDKSLSRIDLLSFFSQVSQEEKDRNYKTEALNTAFTIYSNITVEELENIWPLGKLWPELKTEVKIAVTDLLKNPRTFKEAYKLALKLNSQELKDLVLETYTTADSQYKIAVNALYGIHDMPQELFTVAFPKQ